jgi:hypothetical protein
VEEGAVVPLPRPGATLADDPLLAVLRAGARRLLRQAVEAEVEGPRPSRRCKFEAV